MGPEYISILLDAILYDIILLKHQKDYTADIVQEAPKTTGHSLSEVYYNLLVITYQFDTLFQMRPTPDHLMGTLMKLTHDIETLYADKGLTPPVSRENIIIKDTIIRPYDIYLQAQNLHKIIQKIAECSSLQDKDMITVMLLPQPKHTVTPYDILHIFYSMLGDVHMLKDQDVLPEEHRVPADETRVSPKEISLEMQYIYTLLESLLSHSSC